MGLCESRPSTRPAALLVAIALCFDALFLHDPSDVVPSKLQAAFDICKNGEYLVSQISEESDFHHPGSFDLRFELWFTMAYATVQNEWCESSIDPVYYLRLANDIYDIYPIDVAHFYAVFQHRVYCGLFSLLPSSNSTNESLNSILHREYIRNSIDMKLIDDLLDDFNSDIKKRKADGDDVSKDYLRWLTLKSQWHLDSLDPKNHLMYSWRAYSLATRVLDSRSEKLRLCIAVATGIDLLRYHHGIGAFPEFINSFLKLKNMYRQLRPPMDGLMLLTVEARCHFKLNLLGDFIWAARTSRNTWILVSN